MEVGGLIVVRWHPVKIDEAGRRLVAVMAPHHYDALVDVRVLAEIDVAGLVRGQDRVDVEALRQRQPLLLTGGRGQCDGRIDHRQDAVGPLHAMVRKAHEERTDGVLVGEFHQCGVCLSELLLQRVGSRAQRVLRFLCELLAHVGAVGERRVHDDDAGLLRRIYGVFEFGVVGRLPSGSGTDGVVAQIQFAGPLHDGPLAQQLQRAGVYPVRGMLVGAVRHQVQAHSAVADPVVARRQLGRRELQRNGINVQAFDDVLDRQFLQLGQLLVVRTSVQRPALHVREHGGQQGAAAACQVHCLVFAPNFGVRPILVSANIQRQVGGEGGGDGPGEESAVGGLVAHDAVEQRAGMVGAHVRVGLGDALGFGGKMMQGAFQAGGLARRLDRVNRFQGRFEHRAEVVAHDALPFAADRPHDVGLVLDE